MEFGVQTHFSQAWDKALLAKVKAFGATEIRDSAPCVGCGKTAGVFPHSGTIASLFKLGAGAYMDGVATRPYRQTPEQLDDKIAHLRDVMAKYGVVKPIYATEFGAQFTDPNHAPDYMLKLLTVLASAHVREVYWHSPLDGNWYPAMGLLDGNGSAKPAAAAFSFIETSLILLGESTRIDTGDEKTHVYRFGADTYVMWARPRPQPPPRRQRRRPLRSSLPPPTATTRSPAPTSPIGLTGGKDDYTLLSKRVLTAKSGGWPVEGYVTGAGEASFGRHVHLTQKLLAFDFVL